MTIAVRTPAVAGTFYPRERAELSAKVEGMLSHAKAPTSATRKTVKAVVAPHAGYVYSGPVAATAYAELAARAPSISRVVLLGPAHRVRLQGLALPNARAMRTPLGDVPVDADAVASLQQMPHVLSSEVAHAREHSLEVHLPFLQSILGSFTIVPLVVGDASPDLVAEVLERLWGGEETAVVISSDLSHYLPYETGRRVDEATARAIENLEPVTPAQACGARPLNGLVAFARSRGLSVELLDLRSSGDTAGPRDEVVGYGSFAVRESSS